VKRGLAKGESGSVRRGLAKAGDGGARPGRPDRLKLNAVLARNHIMHVMAHE